MLVEGLISTIIPFHNRPLAVARGGCECARPDLPPVEIIIVDDGSTDETGREAEALAEAHSEVRAIHRQKRRRAERDVSQRLNINENCIPDHGP